MQNLQRQVGESCSYADPKGNRLEIQSKDVHFVKQVKLGFTRACRSKK